MGRLLVQPVQSPGFCPQHWVKQAWTCGACVGSRMGCPNPWEVEAEGSAVQGHTHLHSKSAARVEYLRLDQVGRQTDRQIGKEHCELE